MVVTDQPRVTLGSLYVQQNTDSAKKIYTNLDDMLLDFINNATLNCRIYTTHYL